MSATRSVLSSAPCALCHNIFVFKDCYVRISLFTRLGLLLVVLLMALLPVALGVYVNETSPAPTSRLLPGRCSRYCEAHR